MTFRKNKTDKVISKPPSLLQNAQRRWFSKKGSIQLHLIGMNQLVNSSHLEMEVKTDLRFHLYRIASILHKDVDETWSSAKELLPKRNLKKEIPK